MVFLLDYVHIITKFFSVVKRFKQIENIILYCVAVT